MKLRQLFEKQNKSAVVAFGRLNPPTTGHAKLVEAIKSNRGDPYLFLSQTQKPKTDPLEFSTKLKFAKDFFPQINIGHQNVRTPIEALQMIQSLGYTDVIFVAGSDRVDSFQKLFDAYNGQPNKAGDIPFEFDSIQVVSAGERDPDADDVSGMSASKMRAAAAQGDFDEFEQGVPNPNQAKALYDAVRMGMGVKEPEVEEDASAEEEDAFHVALDKLVHKYFGHSSAEKKKARADEAELVIDKASLVPYLREMIIDYIEQEDDIKKLSNLLKLLVGKEIKTRGKRYAITKEAVVEACKYGMYYCSTERRKKCRQSPKQSRGS
jgi:hypothetical protein